MGVAVERGGLINDVLQGVGQQQLQARGVAEAQAVDAHGDVLPLCRHPPLAPCVHCRRHRRAAHLRDSRFLSFLFNIPFSTGFSSNTRN